jgi:hypothetical protein
VPTMFRPDCDGCYWTAARGRSALVRAGGLMVGSLGVRWWDGARRWAREWRRGRVGEMPDQGMGDQDGLRFAFSLQLGRHDHHVQ